MTQRPLPLALALLGCLVPGAAQAITCSVVDTTPVSFGAYDVFSTSPVDTAGDVTLHCTSVGTTDVIVVEMSEGGGASFAPRALAKAGGGELEYNLYQNAGRSIVWGDGSGSTSVLGPYTPPDDADDTLTIYGRVPANQDVESGTYSDTVTVTINY